MFHATVVFVPDYILAPCLNLPFADIVELLPYLNGMNAAGFLFLMFHGAG